MELISKADAVQVIWESVTRESATKKIDELPTIEERKEGEWMERKDILGFDTYPSTVYCCSQCYSSRRNKTKFCPNCGAKMGGE